MTPPDTLSPLLFPESVVLLVHVERLAPDEAGAAIDVGRREEVGEDARQQRRVLLQQEQARVRAGVERVAGLWNTGTKRQKVYS